MTDVAEEPHAPVKVGDIVSLHIEGLAAGGDFVGRLGPFAVFVTGAAPSETAKVEITEVAASFARGRVVGVEQPSPDRVQPLCPHAAECGGCDLQHIYYPAQLAQKVRLVRETLRRIGGLDGLDVPPAVGMDEPWGYRNKAEYVAGRDESGTLFLGFLRQGSHQAVPISGCAVQHPLNERIRLALTGILNSHTQGAEEKDSVVQVVSRVSFDSGAACVTVVTLGRPEFVVGVAKKLMETVPQVSGVCHASTRSRRASHVSPAELVAGDPYLRERVGSFTFRISPDSFFQVNPRQASVLTRVVAEFAGITGEEILIEGYSGVGTFLLPLAATCRMATGIEESESAVDDAKANIRQHRLGNTRIYSGKVETILPRFAARRWHAGVVLLDPPRKGCGRGVIAAAADLRPRAVVIVSCDPATLARDLRVAAEVGYQPTRVQVVDMFPHTWHTEAVVVCRETG